MVTHSVEQVIGLGLFMIVFLDFLRNSSRNGAVRLGDFPAYLFVLLGRVLDAFVALIFGLFTKNWGQLSLLKKSWFQGINLLSQQEDDAESVKNLERQWMNWGRQKRLVLIHTLERSGAKIIIEKNKLPGYSHLQPPKGAQPGSIPKVKTLDFLIQYSARNQEVHFIPQYFFGVDPSIRSAIRQRVDDGTIAVAFGIPGRNVSFVERDGNEVIVVKVGPDMEQRTPPPPIPKAGKGPSIQSRISEELDLSPIAEGLPPLTVFAKPKVRKAESRDTAEMVLQGFSRLNIGVDSSGASRFRHVKTVIGPAVTQVIFQSSGMKISSLTKEGENIAAELGIQGSVRISAVSGMPGCFGVEVPNEQRGIVTIQEMVAKPEFRQSKSALPLCIGVTINGKSLIVDLAKLPHLLVAGATNQGKSVGLNAMILSLVLRHLPDKLKLIMVDPKAVELTVYEDLPHLLAPIATEAKDAMRLLDTMVSEMEHRYSLLRAKKARNISEYNAKVPETEQLPYIVGIIDEYADLIMGSKGIGKELETAVARLGQKARAAGEHLILATQRPTADIVTGLIKANMPGRLAYKVSSTIDSQVIIDRPGAESLTGMGDLLLLGPQDSEPMRAQGPLVTDEEIERVVDFWRKDLIPTEMDYTRYSDNEAKIYDSPTTVATQAKLAKGLESNEKACFEGSATNVFALRPSIRSGHTGKIENNGVQTPSDPKSDIELHNHGLPSIPTTLIVEGKSGHKVNLGLPTKPKDMTMDDRTWAIMYGYSLRVMVRDKAPRREYIQVMLSIKTIVAHSIIKQMEEQNIISPYRGPKAPRQIYVTLEQVETIYPSNVFSVDNYTKNCR